MIKLMTAMLMWISSQTGLPWDGTYPVLRFEDHKAICQTTTDSEECSVIAYTEMDTGTITMDRRWKENGVFSQSVMIHELTHYLQSRTTGEQYACASQVEYEAYTTQLKYLEATGLTEDKAFEVMGWDKFSYIMLKFCDGT